MRLIALDHHQTAATAVFFHEQELHAVHTDGVYRGIAWERLSATWREFAHWLELSEWQRVESTIGRLRGEVAEFIVSLYADTAAGRSVHSADRGDSVGFGCVGSVEAEAWTLAVWHATPQWVRWDIYPRLPTGSLWSFMSPRLWKGWLPTLMAAAVGCTLGWFVPRWKWVQACCRRKEPALF